MKKLIKLSIIIIALFTYQTEASAAPGQAGNFFGNTTTYQVTISKIEISQDNSTWVTLGEGAQTFNIASTNVGAAVGNYVSNTAIPAGTYLYVRVTVSRTMQINGTGQTGGVTYYTTANTVNVGMGTIGIGTNIAGGQAAATIIIPSDGTPIGDETVVVSGGNLIVTETLSSPFTVLATGGTININFDTQNTVEFDPNENALPNPTFYPRPPAMTIVFEPSS